MFRYALLLFIRNIRRQKLFSFINLLGLTISMASTLLIYLYVSHEFSYDRFHPLADRIYRVNQTFIWGEGDDHQFASTGPGVATALREELAEVEMLTSIHTPGNYIISYTNSTGQVISLEEDKILAADTNFFKMFHFPVVKGNAVAPLRQSNTMVMTSSTARKYFGAEDPIGKLVRLGVGDAQQTYEVTAIVEDPPENSYIEFNALLSLSSFPAAGRLHWSWVWTQLETFILLKEGTNIENTRTKLAAIPRKYAEETLQRIMNVSYEEYIKSGKKWELFLQPITEIHLPSEIVYNRLNESGNITIIYSMIGAALFILLLSCVNFMNLSTAQFTRRIKEASIRKILGLGKKELGISYFLEALAFCFISLFLALALTQLLLPGFNQISGKSLTLNLVSNPRLLFSLIGLIIFMALLSSSYPALFLSSFHPVEAIKGKLKAGREGKFFRDGLVVFQFTVSIILIVCTGIVFQQLSYVSGKDLGFTKENLLVIKNIEHIKNAESLAEAALNLPGVITVSRSSSLPPRIFGGDKFSAEEMNNETFSLNYTSSDERFLATLNIQLKFGRNFSKAMPGDAERVILNETALKRIGWAADESVIGKKIFSPGGEITFEVIGVVGDFNYWSLENPIEPMGIFHINSKNLFGLGGEEYLTLRVSQQSAEAWQRTLEETTALWNVYAGDSPFQYEFVDQAFAETFKTQASFGKALSVMATLAILIASLGLLGMIIYTLEQRTKEIGIRKVSGASVWDILKLISKGYTRLIMVAFVMGAPFSYWLMQQWLSDFAYRITPSLWIFVITGLSTLLIAMLITSYHAVKAALTNPVDVLKDE
jgi:putative ABC transport system permease protein